MSTSATIAVLNKSGSVTYTYVHFDGYLDNVGRLLVNTYNNYDIIKQLMKLGYLSYLTDRLTPSEDSNHSFDAPEEGVTVSYLRDRAGMVYSQVRAKTVSLYQFKQKPILTDYYYIFVDGAWYYYKGYYDGKKLLVFDDE